METGDRAHLHEAMGKMKSGINVTPEVATAFGQVRETAGCYLTCAYDATAKDTVILKSSGCGGWTVCAETLGDGDITFGVFDFTSGGQRRLAFFSWVGPNVSPLKKGKVPLQRGGVYASFPGLVADLSLVEREDAEAAAVRAKLAKSLRSDDIAL